MVSSCNRTHFEVKIFNNYLRDSIPDDNLEYLTKLALKRLLLTKTEHESLVNVSSTGANKKISH